MSTQHVTKKCPQCSGDCPADALECAACGYLFSDSTANNSSAGPTVRSMPAIGDGLPAFAGSTQGQGPRSEVPWWGSSGGRQATIPGPLGLVVAGVFLLLFVGNLVAIALVMWRADNTARDHTRALAARGRTTSAQITSEYTHSVGHHSQVRVQHFVYSFKAEGVIVNGSLDELPPGPVGGGTKVGDLITVTYLPGNPTLFQTGVVGPAQLQQSDDAINTTFMIFGVGIFIMILVPFVFIQKARNRRR